MNEPRLVAPASPNPEETLLRDARKDFAQFYRTATADDTIAMDALVVAEAAMVAGVQATGGVGPPAASDPQESTGRKGSQQTAELRERVRNCPTFAALISAEKAEIERVLCGM